ncbi:transcriptional regulator [Deinococcus irradiatisoli]|uniref:Transcriptional regulator n=1 Tax=Deinococcus irradiatisoli TaxID=2202254 RepID=A0A2Z3JGZ4_9DEIO|nr:helix-turn-helix domain-containing protein [Deinococcus irradiatisoli]AWN24265.1 transcriptional regulator [Deinococcus irradiatisoli]
MEDTRNDQVVLTVTEVASQLRIGRAAAYALVHSGQLKAVRVNRRILVPKAALDDFLQAAGRVS